MALAWVRDYIASVAGAYVNYYIVDEHCQTPVSVHSSTTSFQRQNSGVGYDSYE